MPAISSKRVLLLQETVQALFVRMHYHTLKNMLTHEHLFHMFVKPEDHEAVKKAGKLFSHARGGTFHTEIHNTLGTFKVRVQAHPTSGKPFLHPHYMGKERYTDDTYEGNQALDAWVGERYRLGCEFGLVTNVLWALNDRCETAAQMRFFWPGLATLASQTEGLEKFADTLREANTPPVIPRLEPELREACRATTTLLTRAVLLPKDTPARGELPVKLEIAERPQPKVPWTRAKAAFWY